MAGKTNVLVLVLAGLVAGSLVWLSCEGSARRGAGVGGTEFHVLKIEGITSCRNYTLAPFFLALGEPGLRPAGILARDGDLLMCNEQGGGDKSFPFPYRAADGNTLSLGYEPHRGLLNGKTVSVSLKEDADVQWLTNAPAEELRLIRMVGADVKTTDAARLGVLKRLAEANPNVDLWLVDSAPESAQVETAGQVLPLLRPRILMVNDVRSLGDPRRPLAALQNVETLEIGCHPDTEGVRLDFLAEMPRLRHLLLQEHVLEKAPLPRTLKGLKALTVIDKQQRDLSAFAHLTGLEELHLVQEDLEDLGPLAKFSRLRILSLTGCVKVQDLSALASAPLVWLTPPPAISQEQFSAVVKQHPNLEVMELFAFGNKKIENITDVSCLKTLRRLQALTLVDVQNLRPETKADLKALKGLRLLVVPPDTFNPPAEEVAELQKALPDTLIVAGKGLCLGSGWLLALVPVVAGAWAVAALRRQKRKR
jgi:hypothetical protein